jgi:poly(3-hydroxybutyrate) depolymerase
MMLRHTSAGLLLWLFALACACAAEPMVIERSATLAGIFPAEQVRALRSVLPEERRVTWTLRLPSTSPRGVLVFVRPDAAADPPPGWDAVLDRHALVWIAARDFGNRAPSNQRVLVALMGLALARRDYVPADARRYISGMSGGGRIASMAITTVPQRFDGALYIVGADDFGKAEPARLAAIAAKRYVFLTGENDFNRRDMRHVHERYRKAGVAQALLLDLPHFAHQYPGADDFERALAFLDGDMAP